jgi:hypothetical protein
VNFRGKADPGMSVFASQLAEVQKTQATGAKIDLNQTKNTGKGSVGTMPVYKKYGKDFDEEDILYDGGGLIAPRATKRPAEMGG